MRHRVAYRKLGRVTEHRLSMLRNQSTALLRHEHLTQKLHANERDRTRVLPPVGVAVVQSAAEGSPENFEADGRLSGPPSEATHAQ